MSSVPLEHQAPCGVLATPETEVRGRPFCNHPPSRRREGERKPMRYGSSPTEECSMCGAWRTVFGHGVPGAWNAASVSRLSEDDDV